MPNVIMDCGRPQVPCTASRKAGEAPKESLYQFKLQCASDASDTAAMAAVLADLIRLTH